MPEQPAERAAPCVECGEEIHPRQVHYCVGPSSSGAAPSRTAGDRCNYAPISLPCGSPEYRHGEKLGMITSHRFVPQQPGRCVECGGPEPPVSASSAVGLICDADSPFTAHPYDPAPTPRPTA